MGRPLVITDEFARALDLLHSGSSLFLTGKAGTGKSTLIRRFLEETDRRAITVAPTGIAALNVDGYTIHRLFSFPTGVTAEDVRGPRYFPGRFASTLANLEILIVDEASMVRADLFDALAAALERFGPRRDEPFGGVQLVLVGDLYQLPPVVTDAEAPYIDATYATPYFFSAHAFDRTAFPTVELTTVFRQQGDDRMVDLLNSVRDGALLDSARAELNLRTDRDFEPPRDEFWLTLATTNRIVGARNRQMLEQLGAQVLRYTAVMHGDRDGFEMPTDEHLDLAVGAQVMLLTNDPADRWANGTLGRIETLGSDGDGPVVSVRLRDGRSVAVREHTWEITRPRVEGGSLTHDVIGTFTQLPMKLAWAITIHKSQGQTLDRVVVDLTGGTFANGQLYVALSRCTSMEGLVLRREVLPRDLKSDIRIRRFLANAGAARTTSAGLAFLSVISIGNHGDRYRPRPIEIAVVTDDGDEAVTVVNPTSDLFNAQTDYGITTADVQLAPLLPEAWAALSPLLAGRVPVGVGIDETLALVDFELKRCGLVERLPIGRELPPGSIARAHRELLASPSALKRARAMADAVRHHGWASTEGAQGTPFPAHPRGRGYLLARTTGPGGQTGPEGFVVGGNLSAQDDAAAILAESLAAAWERLADKSAETLTRLRTVEHHYGVRVLPDRVVLADELDLETLLLPGARVCFTGTVVDGSGRVLERVEMEGIAARCGLVPAPSVTKSRTDALVVAERGTQSSKARKANDYGTPVIAAADFLEWAAGR